MTTENMNQEIQTLEEQGWEVDDGPRGLTKVERFDSYADSVQRLVRVGQRAQEAGVMPSIEVENGTEVTLRVGPPPSRVLTAAEIELAKSLTNA